MRTVVAKPEVQSVSGLGWKQYTAEMLEDDRPSDQAIEERFVPPLSACIVDKISENAEVAVLDLPYRDTLTYAKIHSYEGVPVRVICAYIIPGTCINPDRDGKFCIRADVYYKPASV